MTSLPYSFPSFHAPIFTIVSFKVVSGPPFLTTCIHHSIVYFSLYLSRFIYISIYLSNDEEDGCKIAVRNRTVEDDVFAPNNVSRYLQSLYASIYLFNYCPYIAPIPTKPHHCQFLLTPAPIQPPSQPVIR